MSAKLANRIALTFANAFLLHKLDDGVLFSVQTFIAMKQLQR